MNQHNCRSDLHRSSQQPVMSELGHERSIAPALAVDLRLHSSNSWHRRHGGTARRALRCQPMKSKAVHEAERAIEHCRGHIDRVRRDIERRERIGHYTADARTRLQILEQALREHAANLDRLTAEAEC